jgi:hypothetical protein
MKFRTLSLDTITIYYRFCTLFTTHSSEVGLLIETFHDKLKISTIIAKGNDLWH